MKRLVALIAAVVGLTIMLTSCEVTQINWLNHTYAVSEQACNVASNVAVKNGVAILPTGPPYYNGESLLPMRVDILKTVYGDMNGDGIKDVAVLLRCSSIPGPHIAPATGYEIQVFTRDGKMLGRLLPPNGQGFGPTPSEFVPTEMTYQASGQYAGHLVTGITSYSSGDQPGHPSVHDTCVWYWWPTSPLRNGTNGFVGVIWTING